MLQHFSGTDEVAVVRGMHGFQTLERTVGAAAAVPGGFQVGLQSAAAPVLARLGTGTREAF